MDNKWHAENFNFNTQARYDNAGGGFVWIEDFLPEQFIKAEYGSLFAYMYRRFGIPQYGSDGHKEIAIWYITTPDPHVALRVSPKPSGIEHSFGYVIDLRIYNDRRKEKQVKAVQKAMIAAILDLLTPVFVRDVPIDAIGISKGSADIYDNACDVWRWAGYGVPVEYFETQYKES